jgi:ferredoxin-NADP reductase
MTHFLSEDFRHSSLAELFQHMVPIMKFIILTSLLACTSTNAFSVCTPLSQRVCKTSLYAADGAPQYEKVGAKLREAEVVGDGSVMLHIDTDEVVDYQPGHVLALEIEADAEKMDEESKTYQDAKANGGWMRGPYTVSRSTDNSIDILIKLVGEKSKRFANAESGTNLKFGGKFKVPILEGIDTETTKRVVLISTGVGVGPCIGAIEKALEQESFPPIDLVASYRTEDEIVYKEHLDKLQKENSKKFNWKTIITSKQGRLSSSSINMKAITESTIKASLEETHFHLIGNGQMVSEFKSGLEQAGVADNKITVEMYFNHKAEVNEDVVDNIAYVMESTASVAI